jgi:hypothetical protein
MQACRYESGLDNSPMCKNMIGKIKSYFMCVFIAHLPFSLLPPPPSSLSVSFFLFLLSLLSLSLFNCTDADDGEFYDAPTKHMQLYDVGMTSMFISEAAALSQLATIIGRPEAAMLAQRVQNWTALLADNLWDAQGGIFTNKFTNNTFYRRISPTSFYPMLTSVIQIKRLAPCSTLTLLPLGAD